jgi:hypothetical protein
MARMRKDRDCTECFMKGCDCECATCRALALRNSYLSQRELDMMNAGSAIMNLVKGGLPSAKADDTSA